jgi:ABC-type dipeptide/oligopeptide/nickel transport system ATPase component
MIAMLLALVPHVLVADEPTAAFEVTTQAQIQKLIRCDLYPIRPIRAISNNGAV